MKNNYEIIRVMNNNVILAKEQDQNQECVLVGKGIGFGQKAGKIVEISKDKIEKSFVTFDKTVKQQYFQVIKNLDSAVVGMCEEIIAMAESELGKMNHQIHVVLTDHIGFALERIKLGMEINNPFMFEIKTLYPEEYKVAKDAVEMLETNLNVVIPKDEIGFVALHLHASRQNKKVSETMKHTRLLKEVIDIIQVELKMRFDEEELTYYRLINHLRGVIDRVTNKKFIENPLLDSIKKEFKVAYKISKHITKHIEKNYDIKVPEQELGYMALHIERIRKVNEIK